MKTGTTFAMGKWNGGEVSGTRGNGGRFPLFFLSGRGRKVGGERAGSENAAATRRTRSSDSTDGGGGELLLLSYQVHDAEEEISGSGKSRERGRGLKTNETRIGSESSEKCCFFGDGMTR